MSFDLRAPAARSRRTIPATLVGKAVLALAPRARAGNSPTLYRPPAATPDPAGTTIHSGPKRPGVGAGPRLIAEPPGVAKPLGREPGWSSDPTPSPSTRQPRCNPTHGGSARGLRPAHRPSHRSSTLLTHEPPLPDAPPPNAVGESTRRANAHKPQRTRLSVAPARSAQPAPARATPASAAGTAGPWQSPRRPNGRGVGACTRGPCPFGPCRRRSGRRHPRRGSRARRELGRVPDPALSAAGSCGTAAVQILEHNVVREQRRGIVVRRMEADDVSEALIAQRMPVGLRWRIRHAGERRRSPVTTNIEGIIAVGRDRSCAGERTADLDDDLSLIGERNRTDVSCPALSPTKAVT